MHAMFPWKFERSRSSKVIDLCVSQKRICDFLLVINCNFKLSPTVFEILTHKAIKYELVFPTPLLFDAAAQGEPSEFLDETYPAKTRGTGLPYGKKIAILTSTVYDWSIHVTDGRTSDST